MPPSTQRIPSRWRYYRMAAGACPVRDFIDDLSVPDRATVAAAMKDVQLHGLPVARHLHGDIWEVRAEGDHQAFRILFAPQGRHSQILLALEGFSKKSQRTPPAKIDLAEERLADWRRRGDAG